MMRNIRRRSCCRSSRGEGGAALTTFAARLNFSSGGENTGVSLQDQRGVVSQSDDLHTQIQPAAGESRCWRVDGGDEFTCRRRSDDRFDCGNHRWVIHLSRYAKRLRQIKWSDKNAVETGSLEDLRK